MGFTQGKNKELFASTSPRLLHHPLDAQPDRAILLVKDRGAVEFASDITINPHQLPIPEDGPLLIAATLLAGAEHLLDTADPSFNRPDWTPPPQKAPPR